jgi:hypothetical protein
MVPRISCSIYSEAMFALSQAGGRNHAIGQPESHWSDGRLAGRELDQRTKGSETRRRRDFTYGW